LEDLLFVEHSQMANARFQAAAALQDSTIREWSLLMADEKSNLRKYVKKMLLVLLNYLMIHWCTDMRVV
jgi:hypothetical protein